MKKSKNFFKIGVILLFIGLSIFVVSVSASAQEYYALQAYDDLYAKFNVSGKLATTEATTDTAQCFEKIASGNGYKWKLAGSSNYASVSDSRIYAGATESGYVESDAGGGWLYLYCGYYLKDMGHEVGVSSAGGQDVNKYKFVSCEYEPPPPPPPPGDYPADVLDLTNWKITLPIDSGLEIKQPELATYEHEEYFYDSGNLEKVVFKAHCGGETTPGSTYPRSELREMKNNGQDNASWSTTSGTHSMYIEQAITHLPVVKPHVVAGQIHDSGDDITVFRLEGDDLWITDGNETHAYLVDGDYSLGTVFTVEFVVSGGEIDYYYNGDLVYNCSKSTSGCYFKAGCYTQSNTDKGDEPDAYGQVEIYDLIVTHN